MHDTFPMKVQCHSSERFLEVLGLANTHISLSVAIGLLLFLRGVSVIQS